jgi:hypothetical protein
MIQKARCRRVDPVSAFLEGRRSAVDVRPTALEEFLPTPKFSEVAEAQAHLAALAQLTAAT